MAITFRNFLVVFLFLLCSFPYVSLFDTPFDTQPYAILYTSLFFLLIFFMQKDLKIPTLIIPYMIACAYSIVYFFISPISTSSLRSLVGYFSVLIFALAGYHTFKMIKPRVYMLVVWVWLIFGLLQTFINKNIGSFLLPRLSTSADRGVTSLAPEPSYYAVTCIFLLLINDVYHSQGSYSKKVYRFFLSILIIQLLLAKGGLSIVFLFIYLFAKVVSNSNPVKIIGQFLLFTVLFSFLVFVFVHMPNLQSTRISVLLTGAINNPISLLYQDGSMADRMAHILISFQSIFYNFGLGFGLGTWNEHSMLLALSMGGITSDLALIRLSLSGRVMSGWGAPLYELGVVGGIFVVAFLYMMRRGYKVVNRTLKPTFIVGAITIFLVMINAVPLSFPLFGYVIGIFIYLQSRERTNEQSEQTAS